MQRLYAGLIFIDDPFPDFESEWPCLGYRSVCLYFLALAEILAAHQGALRAKRHLMIHSLCLLL